MRRRIGSAVLAGVVVLAATGCTDLGSLDFKQDHRLSFTSPASNALVKTPFTLRWSMRDFTTLPAGSTAAPSTHAGYFAVFIDQAPIKPGHSITDVGEDDPVCSSDPHCPNPTYLNTKGVYVTTEPELTLDNVMALANQQKVQQHDATVVLLDSTFHRIGESSWYLLFRLDNKVASL